MNADHWHRMLVYEYIPYVSLLEYTADKKWTQQINIAIGTTKEREGINKVNVGVIAIFGGHNGAEASDLSSKLLLDYLLLHICLLRDASHSILPTNFFERLSSRI